MAKLFIVGFPKEMQEIELVELFSVHGTVDTVTIVTDKITGASKGYAFIAMTDDAGADRAIQALDGTHIGERTLNVRFAEEKQSAKPVSNARPKLTTSAASPHRESFAETSRPKRPRRPQ